MIVNSHRIAKAPHIESESSHESAEKEPETNRGSSVHAQIVKDKSSDTSLTEVRRVSLHTMSKVPSLTIEGADLKVELNE